jgi:hypothetical protein
VFLDLCVCVCVCVCVFVSWINIAPKWALTCRVYGGWTWCESWRRLALTNTHTHYRGCSCRAANMGEIALLTAKAVYVCVYDFLECVLRGNVGIHRAPKAIQVDGSRPRRASLPGFPRSSLSGTLASYGASAVARTSGRGHEYKPLFIEYVCICI